jgi:hypothetical protein
LEEGGFERVPLQTVMDVREEKVRRGRKVEKEEGEEEREGRDRQEGKRTIS